jgi:site-specific DNA-methyltransferase (adenine-specific)
MKTKVSKSLPISEKYSLDQINEQRATKIMAALKEAAELGDDNQEKHTPLEVCDMILSKIDLALPKSILVLYNIELIFALRKAKYKGDITFLTSSLKKVELVQKINYNINIEYINKEENPLYHLEMKVPKKFDIILSNPPYGSGTKKLDIKFLDKCLDLANDQIVFVHPSSQYVDGKGLNSTYNSINSKILPHIYSIDFFNGNGIFDIGLYVPCCITNLKINNNLSKFYFSDKINNQKIEIPKTEVYNLSIFGYRKELISLKDKIKKYKDSGETIKKISNVLGFSGDQSSKKILNNPLSYYVEFTHITAGNIRGKKLTISDKIHNKDFFIAISKYQLLVKRNNNPKFAIWFEFGTENEAENFISYLKSNFFRACLATVKTNQNLAKEEFNNIPLVDFTQKWDDEKLYAHFEITKKEQSFINEIILPYYD